MGSDRAASAAILPSIAPMDPTLAMVVFIAHIQGTYAVFYPYYNPNTIACITMSRTIDTNIVNSTHASINTPEVCVRVMGKTVFTPMIINICAIPYLAILGRGVRGNCCRL